MVLDKSEDFSYLDRSDTAKKIKDIINSTKVKECDNSVLYKLMQYAYNHVTNVLEDAKKYSEHANKNEVDVSDVTLALKMSREEMAGPILRNELLEIASQVNRETLPDIKEQCGIALPSTKCLGETNFKMKIMPKMHLPVPVIIPKSQIMSNNSYGSTSGINIANSNSAVFKRSKLANMDEQKIIFRPRLKINIKTEDDATGMKKQRIN